MESKKIIAVLFFLVILLAISHSTCYAGSQEMQQLNYEASLNADGSMDVTETWNVYVSETNTLFKTFTLDSSKYKEITNVEVSEIQSNGETKNFSEIKEEMYHVTKNCYYGLQTKSDTFEIAWGVGLDNTSANKRYQIKYTVVDAIKVYQDCSELYWMFLSKDNAIPVKNLTGTISLPANVSDKENLRAWAHGPLNGTIQIPNTNTITFEVTDLSANTMVEVRIATLENIFEQSSNNINENKFNSILEEEIEWAEQANRTRKITKIIGIGIVVLIVLVEIVLIIVWLKKMKKYRKILQETPELEKIEKIQYFRDIPDEKATPADAAFLYYFKHNKEMDQHLAKILSATLLDLCMKKRLAFDVIEEKKEIQILLKQGEIGEELEEDEKIIYELIEKVAKEDGTFTIKDLENYAKEKSSTFLKALNKLSDIAIKKQQEKENYDEKTAKEQEKWNNKFMGYIFSAIFIGVFCSILIIFIIPILIELVINAMLCKKISKKYSALTIKGREEKEKWEALNRYMEDFSMMKEKTVPELILWEKYLIFATAFGSADKVIRQLKIQYPELQDTNYMRENGYYYLYLMNTSHLQKEFITSLNTAVSRAYNASVTTSSASSGGGYGGGFSSGGGGRRWRRPEWVADNKTKMKEGKIAKIWIRGNSYPYFAYNRSTSRY